MPGTIDTETQTYKVGNTTYNARTGAVVSGEQGPYNPFKPLTTPPVPGAISPAVVSSRQASEKASQAVADYTNIQTQRTQQDAQKTAAEAATRGRPAAPAEQEEPLTLAFQDPQSGGIRTQTIYNPSVNRSQVQGLIDGGWEAVGGTIPKGVGPQTTSSAVSALDEEDKEYESLVSDLDSIRSTLSSAQQAYVDSIKGVYETRRTQMADVNKREQASLEAFGIASGGLRRTASFGGILSEQERQGISRLKELDLEEKQLVSQAELEYAQEDFRVLSEKINLYNERREEKAKVLAEIQKAALEANKKAMEQQRKASVGVAVAGLMRQGVTDPKTILEYLNTDESGALIGDVSADELKTILDTYNSGGAAKDIGEVVKAIGKNGAPSAIIDAVSGASTLAEAVKAAGQYLQDIPTGGVVGEYLFYKKQAEDAGQVPLSFDEYQTRDANRKRSVTIIGDGTGMTTTQQRNFVHITDKFQADPIMMAATKGRTAVEIAHQVLADPGSATNQLKALYTLVKNLDPDSAVREGETALAQQTQSYWDNFRTSIERVGSGKIISASAAEKLAQATIDLAGAWEASAKSRKQQYRAQASGAGIAPQFDEYLTTAETDIGQEIIQSEDGAKQEVVSYT